MGTVESSNLYSQLKSAWHPDRIEAFRAGQTPVPIHVQLILSDLCNQDCHFCAYRMSAGLSNELFVGDSEVAKIGTNNPIRQIPTEKALEIVADCGEMGVKAIQFTGGGEPTVHPQYLEIINAAQQLEIDTALVTNGLKLDPASPTIWALEWIRVSVDAGDEWMYAKVRRVPPAHWKKVWANIGRLAQNYGGVLGIGFVVTPQNYKGIVSAAHLAKEHGAQNMRVGAVFSADGLSYYGDEVLAIRDAIAEAKAKVDERTFEVIDLFGRRLADLDGGHPEDPECYYQYLTVYIGGDLNVYRCCNTAYTLAGKVGSLRDQRFKDALLSYMPFDARDCRYCQFRGQNKGLKALVEQPGHVNFV